MRQMLCICAIGLAGARTLAAQGTPDDDKILTTFQNPVGNLITCRSRTTPISQ